MISFLKGTLIEKHPTAVIVESGGIGFEIVIPLSTYSQLPIVNENIQLHMHLHIREDAWQLFGFWTAEERALFKLLVSISGIGPKLGITILSGIGIANFKRAVVQRDIASLTGISGIGRKTAERIIIELKEKISIDKECMTDEALPLVETEDVLVKDSVTALVSLGFKKQQALTGVKKILSQENKEQLTVEDVIRRSLQHI